MRRLVVRKILNEIRKIITIGLHMGIMMQCMAMVLEGQIQISQEDVGLSGKELNVIL
jgi:hypothetical protein